MRKKGLIWLCRLAAILVAIGVGLAMPALAQASVRLTELGRAPFMGAIRDKLDLVEKFTQHKSEAIELIQFGRRCSTQEAQEVANCIESALRSDAGVTEVTLPDGTVLPWMGWKSRVTGKLMITRDVILSLGRSVNIFIISCLYKGEEIKFAFPRDCGNLAFLEAKPLPAPPPKAEIVPPAPPPVMSSIPPTPPAHPGPASVAPPPSERVVERVIERTIIEERPVYIHEPVYVPEYVPLPRRDRYIPFVPGRYDYGYSAPNYDYGWPVTFHFDFHWSKVSHRYRRHYEPRHYPPSPPRRERRDRYCPPGSPGRR